MYSTLAQPKSASPVPNQYSGPMPQHHATHRHASTPNVQLRNVSAFPAFLFSLIVGILPPLREWGPERSANVRQFADTTIRMDGYELRAGRHPRPFVRPYRRYDHRAVGFRMPVDEHDRRSCGLLDEHSRMARRFQLFCDRRGAFGQSCLDIPRHPQGGARFGWRACGHRHVRHFPAGFGLPDGRGHAGGDLYRGHAGVQRGATVFEPGPFRCGGGFACVA